MRRYPCLLSILFIVLQQYLLFHSVGNDFPPKAFDPKRYEAISERNPFGSAIVPEIPAPNADWAKGIVLRAVTRIDGHYVVHVENTIKGSAWKSLRLVEGHEDLELTIKQVKPHRNPAQVEVLVTRSNPAGEPQTATLTYAPSSAASIRPGKRVVLPPNKRTPSR